MVRHRTHGILLVCTIVLDSTAPLLYASVVVTQGRHADASDEPQVVRLVYDSGLTPRQEEALDRIAEYLLHRGRTPTSSELGAVLNVSKSQAHNLATRLVQHGFLSRQKRQGNRAPVHFTTSVRNHYERMLNQTGGVQLSPANRQLYTEVLQLFAAVEATATKQ